MNDYLVNHCIVFGTLSSSAARRLDNETDRLEGHLSVSGVYATLDEAQRSLHRASVEQLAVAIRADLPAHAYFEVLQGSPCDSGGRRSVAVMSSFTEALRVADGRGFMGIGQCRIDMVFGPRVYATAAEFSAAGANPSGFPLLSFQGLPTRYFSVERPEPPTEPACAGVALRELERVA